MRPVVLFPTLYNISPFLQQEHPTDYHPDSLMYEDYWIEIEHKCVEGFWGLDQLSDIYNPDLEGGHRFMPPQLYFYINICKIIDEDEESNSTREISPYLRDIEWIFGYDYIIARGFSGYTDSEYTCYKYVKYLEEGRTLKVKEKNMLSKAKGITNADGSYKKYKDPIEILHSTYDKPQGRPLYANEAKNEFVVGTRGGGKMLNKDELVRVLNGWKKIGNLKIGDKVYGSDGKLTNITNVTPVQRNMEMYTLSLRDGRTIDACKDHLWKVFNKNTRKYETKSTEQLFKNYYTDRVDSKHRKKYKKDKYTKEFTYAIPVNKCIEESEKNFYLHPYVLGCLLGDGSLTKKAITLTSGDDELVERFCKFLPKEYKANISEKDIHKVVRINRINDSVPIFSNVIEELGLLKTSQYKHIPEQYLYGSESQRLELLKGLMDTDGTSDNTHLEYYTSSKQLSKDVQNLVRSLGMSCKVSLKKTHYKKNGVKINCLDYYRISIYTDKPIFSLDRKLKYLQHTKSRAGKSKQEKTFIVDIQKTVSQDGVCIAVDNEDHTYVTKDYIVTHNSFFHASCMLHEWYFQGQKVFDITKKLSPIELLVTAANSDKSGDLLDKMKLTMDYIQQGVGSYLDTTGIEDIFYPGYFHLEYTGSTSPNSQLMQKYLKKQGNTWIKGGTGTKISHKILTTENPAVAAGKRLDLILVEEVGLIPNIMEFLGTAKNSTIRGTKTGTICMIGTSGFVDKIAGFKVLMENPDQYDILSFKDVFEGRPKKIGRFIPAYYADNNFKDENGNTNITDAFEYLTDIREEIAKTGDSQALDLEMMNRPVIPSEMFLSRLGTKLPVHLLRERKTELEIGKLTEKIQSIGWLEYNKDKEVIWIPDLSNKLKPITTYNLDQYNGSLRGAIIVYEHPPDNIPKPTFKRSLYKVTYDPVKDDKGGTSLASILVHKGFPDKAWEGGFSDTIVAEWIGRIDRVNDMHEIAIKLALYFNAKILPEINIPDIVRYAEMKGMYNILQPTPMLAIGKVVNNPSTKYEVGVDMSSVRLQEHCMQLLAQWYLNPIKKNEEEVLKRNLDNVYSLRLLEESILYNGNGNYDHLRSAMLMALWLSQETEEPIKDSMEDNRLKSFSEYFSKRKKIKKSNYEFYHSF